MIYTNLCSILEYGKIEQGIADAEKRNTPKKSSSKKDKKTPKGTGPLSSIPPFMPLKQNKSVPTFLDVGAPGASELMSCHNAISLAFSTLCHS